MRFKRIGKVFKTRSKSIRNAIKTCSKTLLDETSLKRVENEFETWSKRVRNVLKTFETRLKPVSKRVKNEFETRSKRVENT